MPINAYTLGALVKIFKHSIVVINNLGKGFERVIVHKLTGETIEINATTDRNDSVAKLKDLLSDVNDETLSDFLGEEIVSKTKRDIAEFIIDNGLCTSFMTKYGVRQEIALELKNGSFHALRPIKDDDIAELDEAAETAEPQPASEDSAAADQQPVEPLEQGIPGAIPTQTQIPSESTETAETAALQSADPTATADTAPSQSVDSQQVDPTETADTAETQSSTETPTQQSSWGSWLWNGCKKVTKYVVCTAIPNALEFGINAAKMAAEYAKQQSKGPTDSTG
jgi:hypothetical protein